MKLSKWPWPDRIACGPRRVRALKFRPVSPGPSWPVNQPFLKIFLNSFFFYKKLLGGLNRLACSTHQPFRTLARVLQMLSAHFCLARAELAHVDPSCFMAWLVCLPLYECFFAFASHFFMSFVWNRIELCLFAHGLVHCHFTLQNSRMRSSSADQLIGAK